MPPHAHTLHIERLATGGAGVAHLPDGRVAFVTGSCPGDTVEAEITAERPRHVEARVVELLQPSPDRVTPPCPYFGVCGGCQWQHVAIDVQLRAKRDAVVQAFARIGDVANADDLVADVVPSPSDYGYRNKIELSAAFGETGLRLGYHAQGSTDIVSVDTCHLLPPRWRTAPKAVRGALRYLSGDQDLGIARVGIRVAAHTRDVEVAIWTPPSGFPRAAAAKTLTDALKATGVVRVLAREDARMRDAPKVEVLKGKGAWKERLAGAGMLISAPTFFQVNTEAAEELVRIVVEAADVGASDSVLDLYSGAGTFTLPLATRAGEVVAVESSRSAIADLRRNLQNADADVEVAPGDAERVLPELGEFDVVVVDPPRAGLAPTVIDALSDTGARRLAYVSCDPATLARDVGRLSQSGYSLERAIPVDLFPQTYHVETVAVLRPAEARS